MFFDHRKIKAQGVPPLRDQSVSSENSASFDSRSSDQVYLNAAYDQLEPRQESPVSFLLSEPSDSSVVAELNEGVDLQESRQALEGSGDSFLYAAEDVNTARENDHRGATETSSSDESDSSQSPTASGLVSRSKKLKKVFGINALSKVNLKKVKHVKRSRSSVDVELLGDSLAMCSMFEKEGIENLNSIRVALIGASKDASVRLADTPRSNIEQQATSSVSDQDQSNDDSKHENADCPTDAVPTKQENADCPADAVPTEQENADCPARSVPAVPVECADAFPASSLDCAPGAVSQDALVSSVRHTGITSTNTDSIEGDHSDHLKLVTVGDGTQH